MKKEKTIIMTGGGSAGHVTPNLALIPKLKEIGYKIEYIGSKEGIEKKLIEEEKISYHSISSGKLRRYFDFKNFVDPFKVIKGFFDSFKLIKKIKPNIIFSKGGFVSVPVVIAGYFKKIPIIIHESDMTPGLANKLSIPFASCVCLTFPESLKHIRSNKGILTGSPIRKEILNGDRKKGLNICNFKDKKPILLIIGGSLGSQKINQAIRNSLDTILAKFNVIHICGKGNIDEKFKSILGYRQYEFVKRDLPHLLKASDLVISRAGANVIFELLSLRKPNLLIPLSTKSSRGDQLLNANSFKNSGYSLVLEEENLSQKSLYENLIELEKQSPIYIQNMIEATREDAVEKIVNIIEKNN